MVPTTTVAASLQGRYEGESSLDLSRSLNLLTVSNRRKVSPTLNRVAMHWAVKAEMYLGPILHHGEDGLQSVELTHDGDGLLVPSICTLEDLY